MRVPTGQVPTGVCTATTVVLHASLFVTDVKFSPAKFAASMIPPQRNGILCWKGNSEAACANRE
jgi:hypothetical protein